MQQPLFFFGGDAMRRFGVGNPAVRCGGDGDGGADQGLLQTAKSRAIGRSTEAERDCKDEDDGGGTGLGDGGEARFLQLLE